MYMVMQRVPRSGYFDFAEAHFSRRRGHSFFSPAFSLSLSLPPAISLLSPAPLSPIQETEQKKPNSLK